MVCQTHGFKASIRAFKNCHKSWRTLVRPDMSSTRCKFELKAGRTNVLDPLFVRLPSNCHFLLNRKMIDTGSTEMHKNLMLMLLHTRNYLFIEDTPIILFVKAYCSPILSDMTVLYSQFSTIP